MWRPAVTQPSPSSLPLLLRSARRSRLPAAADPFPLTLRSIWRGEAAAGGGAALPSAAVEGDREVADGCGATPSTIFACFFMMLICNASRFCGFESEDLVFMYGGLC